MSLLLFFLDIEEEVLLPELNDSTTQEKLSLDFYLPSLRMAVELQGRHHYYDVHSKGQRDKFKERDAEKRQRCNMAGITLVTVPSSWKGDIESLAELITAFQPSLLPTLPKPTPNSSVEMG